MRLDWVFAHPFVVLGIWQYPALPTNFSATFRGPRETNREARFPRSPGRKGPKQKGGKGMNQAPIPAVQPICSLFNESHFVVFPVVDMFLISRYVVCSIHWGSQSKATGTPNTETTRANDKGGKTFRPGLVG